MYVRERYECVSVRIWSGGKKLDQIGRENRREIEKGCDNLVERSGFFNGDGVCLSWAFDCA